jgi:hypothetical protein
MKQNGRHNSYAILSGFPPTACKSQLVNAMTYCLRLAAKLVQSAGLMALLLVSSKYTAKQPLFCKHDPAKSKYSRDPLPLENICYSTKHILIAGYI